MPYKTASARPPSIVCHNANGADAPEAKIPIKLLNMARHIDDLCDHDSLLIIIRCLWWKLFDTSHMIHLSEIQRPMNEKRNAHVKKSPTFAVEVRTLKGKGGRQFLPELIGATAKAILQQLSSWGDFRTHHPR
jgi:hypothetical protein